MTEGSDLGEKPDKEEENPAWAAETRGRQKGSHKQKGVFECDDDENFHFIISLRKTSLRSSNKSTFRILLIKNTCSIVSISGCLKR